MSPMKPGRALQAGVPIGTPGGIVGGDQPSTSATVLFTSGRRVAVSARIAIAPTHVYRSTYRSSSPIILSPHQGHHLLTSQEQFVEATSHRDAS